MPMKEIETVQVFWSRHLPGWTLQDFCEMCVLCFVMFHLKTNPPGRSTSLMEEGSHGVTISSYEGQLNAGFSLKWCQAHFRDFIKWTIYGYTPVCFCRVIDLNLMLDCDWFLYMSVRRSLGLVFGCYGVQTFCQQSEGLDRREYWCLWGYNYLP